MKAFRVLLAITFCVSTLVSGKDRNRPLEVYSPNHTIKVQLLLQQGVPFYNVQRNDQPVIANSRLGFSLKDIPALEKDFKVIASKPSSFDETWTQPWGEVKNIRNQYNSLTVVLQEQSGLKRKLQVEFRVYNDGIGFRYEIPQQPNLKDFVIMDELTEFAIARDMDAWWIPAYSDDMDSECLFHKNNVTALSQKMHTPLTLESNDLYLSIHEAALIDYASMTLFNNGNKTLKCDLVPWANGDRVVASAPMKTPWRTIQIADKPGDLITSYLILNLNEPNKLGDVSWIKPGKYNGIWWGMHIKTHTWEGGPNHGATTANMKEQIDFASKHHLSSVLAEGWNEGWEGDWTVSGNFNFTKPYPDYDIAEISRYAKSKNIGLIAHHETGGNIANYERQLEDAFKFCAQYDIHRLKTGYVNRRPAGERHQGQFMVRHYHKVMETAARYKVMLDVHEPIKDTGLRRTYPNMMTREGARGTEYEAWSDGNPPAHTTILPFTRCLGGPLDYTPGIFDIQFKTEGTFRVHTTLAKQLALYVVIYSPLQMAADLPKNYEGKPALKFIEDVPTDWEETRVLQAEIGKYVTIARKDRNSADWFLGSITNEDERVVDISLDFLSPGKKYIAEIYQDGVGADVTTNPLPLDILTQDVTKASVLKLKLAKGGGTAIRFHETN
ncbi:MAG TPA: glycoside hydrolase family 97 protein [Ohtaekwangia sp.]|uniref:glycoside hydrolase family 97 protein n=1 Tax=Ohtaekwangia sp. TaxID=2066019 RepID=UPI002F934B9B